MSNQTIPPVSSFQVLSDTVSGAQAQLIKLDKGATGASSPVTDLNPLPVAETQYDVRIDEGSTYTYIGQALPATATATGAWRIKRLVNSTSVVTWADGTAAFSKTWDNRASYTY